MKNIFEKKANVDANQIIPFLGGWSNGDGPLYRQLAQAFIKAIVQGELIPDTSLPAERNLATALAISRSTVVAAYELLRSEGWVTSKQGSRTKICPQTSHKIILLRNNSGTGLARGPFFDRLFETSQSNIDLSVGNTGRLAELPTQLFMLSEGEMSAMLGGRGYTALGLPALRRAIANYYNQAGLETHENQILVTTGAQQAISLLASCYLQRGDKVIIENPTYFGAIDAMRAAGAHLAGVQVEKGGVKPKVLRAQIETSLPRLVYLQPTYQNPTGAVIAALHRREIAQLAMEFNVPVIEDNTLADISLTGETPPPLAAYASEANIITIGSMSKLFWGGLRVGWLRAPEAIITRLGRFKVVQDLGSSPLNQVIAARLLSLTPQIKAARQQELQPKLDLLTGLLSEFLPDWQWQRPTGGIFLWVKLPVGDATTFAQVANRYGVTIIAGSTMAVDETFSNYIRLPFLLEPQTLTEAVQRLNRAWQVYVPTVATQQTHIKIIV